MRPPEWVKTKLLEGENVLSKISQGKADWYATDKRLLVFRGKSDCQVFEYDKISITFTKFGLRVSIARFILIGLGLPVILFGIAGLLWGPSIGPIPLVSPPTYVRISRLEALMVTFLGVLPTLLALFGLVYGYYQINHPSIGKGEAKKWRIQLTRWGRENVDRFVKVVQERSGGVRG